MSGSQEIYLRENGFGGVVNTVAFGEYDELLKMDMCSAFLSKWTVHPTGAGVWFPGSRVDKYATYFAHCIVTINEELPMGVFPYRNSRGRIVYPTLRGVYETYLWKEQIESFSELRCDVKLLGGIAWRNKNSNATTWAKYMYNLRINAPNKFVEKATKIATVSAIGRHGMARKRYFLLPQDKASHESVVILNKYGEPIEYAVETEDNETEAYLVHWQRYTSAMVNLESIVFAWPFAIESRLIQIYHDSVLILEHDETHNFVSRISNEALDQPPGTWLWERLTGEPKIIVKSNGHYIAKESSRRPGVKKA